MNRALTDFERLVCAAGHRLSWHGKWVHVDRDVVFCRSTTATFPRKYFRRVR